MEQLLELIFNMPYQAETLQPLSEKTTVTGEYARLMSQLQGTDVSELIALVQDAKFKDLTYRADSAAAITFECVAFQEQLEKTKISELLKILSTSFKSQEKRSIK